jgi:hypothetical protein
MPSDSPAPGNIGKALVHGIAGDHDRALELLQPLVDEGPRSAFALLGALAEAAAYHAREANGPGVEYDIEVTGPDGPADADVLPPNIRFAAQFVTAWANDDRDTALALFNALADHSDTNGTQDLGAGIYAVYTMAVASVSHAVAEEDGSKGDPR